jgi:hypothetical protein
MEWSVNIEALGPGPYDPEWASGILESAPLADRAAVIEVAPQIVGLTFDIQADSAEQAAVEALRIFRAALPGVEPREVRVQTIEEQERQLAESNVPELLGVAEVAEALQVSKQRVSELTSNPNFPAPIAHLRSGPIWQRSALARFLTSWPRKPGRPRKVGGAAA